jgi:hypothetical protein
MEEDIKAGCPSCHNEPKVLKRCHCCKRWCCNICSIDLICKDCYNMIFKTKEIDRYFDEKYMERRVSI